MSSTAPRRAVDRSPERRIFAAAALALSLAASACSDDAPTQSPAPELPAETPRSTSRKDLYDALAAEDGATYAPSDGGGKAWLELAPGETGEVEASGLGRWTVIYEAGELGVSVGGAVYLQVSPFWDWSTPQVVGELEPGFTRVSTEAQGVELEPATVDRQLLGITIRGRALAAGERLRIEYGAGDALARADTYAEKNSRFWIAVDGDGDGRRKVLADSPGVDVLPGPPARMVATLPTTAHPGDRVRLCVALLDRAANAGAQIEARIEIVEPPEGLELASEIELAPSDLGRKTIDVLVRSSGVYRLRLRTILGEQTLETESNPLVVDEHGPRILWADLHGHSAVSDGTGTPEDYFLYARDVAALDVAALTDHDHWGMLFMDRHPEIWAANVATARRFDEPERFVALPGYEWTSWIWGHRHVLFFGDVAPLLSTFDERSDTPQELWSELRDKTALTIGHHPGGGPIALDLSIAPDPACEPVIEVVSAHGSSEASDTPRRIYGSEAGHFARDALDRGYRLGFVASGDGHDGHPGLTHFGPAYPTGGVAAILSEAATRESVLEAIRARRVYATSGPRMLVRFAIGTARMGESVKADALGEGKVFLQVVAPGAVETVDIVRSGHVFVSLQGESRRELALSAKLGDLKPGEYVYVRVVQQDGGMACSSPIFVE